MRGWGERMEVWNYFQDFHYLGMCPIVEVQHIEKQYFIYVKHLVGNKHISFGFILFRNITWVA